MSKIKFIATTAFGVEATVKREVTKLGCKDISVLDGRINFTGDISTIAKCNIWLRSADRLLINFGEFFAFTFDELFEKTKALPWEEFLTEDAKFTVTGKSIKSTLFSVPDCQSIVKKSIVERLKLKYKKNWFEESGPEYKVQVSLLKDFVTITIDTTGPGLHKRGYRENSVIAPLKETLTSTLIELSYWKPDRILLDPMCGSGTIPIEASLMAKNIAPGLLRKFVSEEWPQIPKKIWSEARKDAYSKINVDFTPEIYGYDIDPKAIELSKHNATLAGVDTCIRFDVKPFKEVKIEKEYGIVICNPPYGERIGELHDLEELYRDMGNLFKKHDTWSVYVITSNDNFERLYGKLANKKRKLFNGMIKTNYYQYIGPRPSKV